eukprot:Gregarina_sp_Poly_1__763@NODE_1182_length_4849_cov_31_140945_g812_i0_p4_GENE_NODE_1182_length_4849_cov_31_140945_g812_i0NODE_1182_length_4849_cov_31_140945_g812_i0_p4_ORF_typecomplete_len212_score9_07_NODE_1182_length_4849_cov_31_140945_g812_i039554590
MFEIPCPKQVIAERAKFGTGQVTQGAWQRENSTTWWICRSMQFSAYCCDPYPIGCGCVELKRTDCNWHAQRADTSPRCARCWRPRSPQICRRSCSRTILVRPREAPSLGKPCWVHPHDRDVIEQIYETTTDFLVPGLLSNESRVHFVMDPDGTWVPDERSPLATARSNSMPAAFTPTTTTTREVHRHRRRHRHHKHGHRNHGRRHGLLPNK